MTAITTDDALALANACTHRTTIETAHKWLADAGQMLEALVGERDRLRNTLQVVDDETKLLTKDLAECRDVFSEPPPGSALEPLWDQAKGCPQSVPDYVRAAVAAKDAELRLLRGLLRECRPYVERRRQDAECDHDSPGSERYQDFGAYEEMQQAEALLAQIDLSTRA